MHQIQNLSAPLRLPYDPESTSCSQSRGAGASLETSIRETFRPTRSKVTQDTYLDVYGPHQHTCPTVNRRRDCRVRYGLIYEQRSSVKYVSAVSAPRLVAQGEDADIRETDRRSTREELRCDTTPTVLYCITYPDGRDGFTRTVRKHTPSL